MPIFKWDNHIVRNYSDYVSLDPYNVKGRVTSESTRNKGRLLCLCFTTCVYFEILIVFMWDASMLKKGNGRVLCVQRRERVPRVRTLMMRAENNMCECVRVCVRVIENPLPRASQHSPMK